MKRSIYALLILPFLGAVFSFLIMYQHYLPNAEFGIFSCGNGAVNPCLAIARSGSGELFGFPLASLGAMAYLFILGAALLTLSAGEERYPHLYAALVPVAVLMVAADIPLIAVMISLGVMCRLCVATYLVNVLICVVLAVSCREMKARGGGFRVLYRELFSTLLKRESRPLAVAAAFGAFFVVLSIVFFSAYLKEKGNAEARPDPRAEKFREYFYSLPQEELSLPPAAMTVGDPSAEIRIAVFTDFLCTACYGFHNVKKALMARFPGRIRVDYYNFPLDTVCNRHSPRTVYPNSCVASQAFLAAAERGVFADLLEYHFSRYPESQSRLHRGDSIMNVKGYFEKRMKGYEYAQFLQEVLSERMKLALNEEIELGGRLNIRSVPTLFINGRRIEGVPNAALLESVIAEELR